MALRLPPSLSRHYPCGRVLRQRRVRHKPRHHLSRWRTRIAECSCAKNCLPPRILHVPFDLAVRGNEVQFARPLFNLEGTRVLGSGLGAGTVDTGGKVQVTSTWDVRGMTVHGDYSGTLHTKPQGTPRARSHGVDPR